MNKFIFGALLLVGCSACSGEDAFPSPAACMQFSTSIAGGRTFDPMTETRTGIAGSTASFISGDRIGVSETLTVRSNVPYTFNGTIWSTPTTMYWRNSSSTHTFYAYYPYNASSSGTSAVLPILNNQAVSASAPAPDAACDMLVAGPKTQTRATGTGVQLTFTHAFSLLQFNIRLGSLLNLYVLNNITIQGGNLTDAANRYGIVNTTNNPALINYDLTTKTIRDYGNTTTAYATSLSRDFAAFSLLTSTTPFYFLILPGTYNNPVPTIRLTVALAGLISVGKNASIPQTTFAANTKYTYEIRIGGLLPAAKEMQVELISKEPICPEEFTTEKL